MLLTFLIHAAHFAHPYSCKTHSLLCSHRSLMHTEGCEVNASVWQHHTDDAGEDLCEGSSETAHSESISMVSKVRTRTSGQRY